MKKSWPMERVSGGKHAAGSPQGLLTVKELAFSEHVLSKKAKLYPVEKEKKSETELTASFLKKDPKYTRD